MRKILRFSVLGLAVVGAGVGGTVGYSTWAWGRSVDVASPPIQADRAPEAVARGAAIFHSTCEVCHRGAGSERASGAPMTDPPAFMGTFYTANLTADRVAGIGSLDDAAIARTIRYGVDRHGHRIPMPSYGMGDADVAAVLGFLRSNDPLFAPDATVAPRTDLSALGKTVIVLTGGATIPARPSRGIPVPERAPTVTYGRYLAHEVYDCAGCHTPGFGVNKTESAELFEGGFEFRDPSGQPSFSKNLTPDATGIAHYERSDMARALRKGVRPDGTVLSAPMPMFRGLTDVDIDALYIYLRSLPARRNEGPGRTPPQTVRSVSTPDPATRFRSLGCIGCHGPAAAHASALARASDKPTPEVARWIRNPERTIPGTPMPTYADLIDEEGALALAEWIKSGGVQKLAAAP